MVKCLFSVYRCLTCTVRLYYSKEYSFILDKERAMNDNTTWPLQREYWSLKMLSRPKLVLNGMASTAWCHKSIHTCFWL